MSRFKTLLLDLDGTLIDSRADLTNAVNHVLAALGHPTQTLDEVVPRIGNGLRRLLVDSVGPMDQKTLLYAKSIFDTFYQEHCTDQTVLYDDVLPSLEQLDDQFSMGVVTNKHYSHAKKIIDALNISRFMDVLIGGDTLPESKPHPAPLAEAIKKMNGNSTTALMVGDGFQDIMAGQAAGVKTCLAVYGFGFKKEFFELNPDHSIQNFSQIKEIVL